MQYNTVRDYRVLVQEYRLLLSPSIKGNVLRESLSEDSQNIPCATLKRRESWVISIYLCLGKYGYRVHSLESLMEGHN